MEDYSEDPQSTGTPTEAVGGLWVGKGPERGFLNSRSLSSRSWFALCAQTVTLNSFQSSGLQPPPRRIVQGPGMRQKAQGDQEGPRGDAERERQTEKRAEERKSNREAHRKRQSQGREAAEWVCV